MVLTSTKRRAFPPVAPLTPAAAVAPLMRDQTAARVRAAMTATGERSGELFAYSHHRNASVPPSPFPSGPPLVFHIIICYCYLLQLLLLHHNDVIGFRKTDDSPEPGIVRNGSSTYRETTVDSGACSTNYPEGST